LSLTLTNSHRKSYRKSGFTCRKFSKSGINLVQTSRPTPASFCSVFLSGIRKRKNVFQVTQYKTFQILVQTFPEPWSSGSQSVFHLRNRQRFQVPGFEWVHELLLFCLASNPAQFCAEISCGKTELEHNCTISISRMKNDFSVCRRGA
jgi:hypothetical protein